MDSDTAPLLISIADAQKRMGGLSRGMVYRLINAGEINRVNIGSRVFVTTESLVAYLDRIKAHASGGAA
ncbi:helix-turn-helix domain-containing protein [Mycobacterium sp. SMC-21]|uniref:helix-turn-helix domain-containing protein n=1 Tax=Mycobacterium sp. SMC-21 TaxID=3381632 RepID=UPI003876A2E7